MKDYLNDCTIFFALERVEEQVSQRDLTENHFRQSALVVEDVTTALIQQFGPIPYYKTPTTSLLPSLVRTPDAHICVDGWNLVDEARKAQQPSIRCEVKYLRQVSETDLAIIKVATRFGRQDSAPYAELAANLRRLYRLLGETTIAPILFTHGGARADGQSNIGQEGDLVGRLAEYLKKDRSTITDSLNYTKHLSDELLNGLEEKGASKKFFEKLASWRRTIRLRLQEQRFDPPEIENRIARAAAQMVEAFIQNGNEAFTTTAKRIYAESTAPTINSTVTAVIPVRTEDTGESDQTRDSEACSGNIETPRPEHESSPAQPGNHEPSGNGQEADDHGQITAEGGVDSNVTGRGGLSVEQVKNEFEAICRNTLAKLAPLTDVQSIHNVLQLHRIEVSKVQQVLIKIHALSAGK